MAAISGVWGLRDRLSIREENSGLFVFQFKAIAERDRVLHGGPWHYNHSMLLLTEYDGLKLVAAAPLHSLEVWVAVKGLGVVLRMVVYVDQMTLKWREMVQRVRVMDDTRRRIRMQRNFQFSPEVSIDLELKLRSSLGFVWVVVFSCMVHRVVTRFYCSWRILQALSLWRA